VLLALAVRPCFAAKATEARPLAGEEGLSLKFIWHTSC